MNILSKYCGFCLILLLLPICKANLFSQTIKQNELNVKRYEGEFNLDGILDEYIWQIADSINGLTMVEPEENKTPSYKTIVKIAANSENIILGIICYDDPSKITAFTKARDVRLYNEDNIKIVFDTYRDQRTGYIFAVNPFGARYDAVIAHRGEGENSNWDGVWNAKTQITSYGWTAEIIIPVKSLSFKKGLHKWGFNVERRIERLLEKDRWTAINKNYDVKSLSKVGIIKNLPKFNLGLGLLMKISPLAGFSKNYGEKVEFNTDISGDLTKRITPDVSATLTINTDFAETEVDSRRTNLTRFPLFFPEKRSFFLEGGDIYDFGIGLGSDIIPFFSRKIGLYKGIQVPIVAGGKLNGKVGNTNFGALYVHTDKVDTLVPKADMGVVRIKQNIFEQSNVGIIATAGDPTGIKNSWLLGADFTYQISDLFGDKNFLAGVWGIYNNRPDLSGNKTSYGITFDYPNDLFDISLKYKFVGDAFLPSIGFVPRTGVKYYHFGCDYMPRPDWGFIRQFFFESGFSLVTDLNNQWESYSFFTAPVHFLMESGDRFEFNVKPTGENLTEPFEIEDGVIIPVGKYNYMRYRLEFELASKRPVSGEATWWFGTFYTGTLDQLEFNLSLRFTSNIIIDLSYEKNIVDLHEGNFQQDLFGGRLQLNFSPDLQLSSFIQYDNDSRSVGTNTRMRWTINPLTDLYVVYNHNINKITDRTWQFDSNQFILKLSYGIWY
jgi:hypothetical protein